MPARSSVAHAPVSISPPVIADASQRATRWRVALTLLDINGDPQRSFSFSDQVTFQGTSYGPPWALTAFDVAETEGTRRVALTAHHYVWDPGLVTILDDRWQRQGTFVHAGWIEGVRWLGRERLLINGFPMPMTAA